MISREDALAKHLAQTDSDFHKVVKLLDAAINIWDGHTASVSLDFFMTDDLQKRVRFAYEEYGWRVLIGSHPDDDPTGSLITLN